MSEKRKDQSLAIGCYLAGILCSIAIWRESELGIKSIVLLILGVACTIYGMYVSEKKEYEDDESI